MSPREWDAATYDQLPLPHVQWGLRTIERMQLHGDERILEAGSGTGRDAAALLDQHPGVDHVGVDGSSQMVDAAIERIGDRAAFTTADLTEPLTSIMELGRTAGPFDMIMSVACFHWITDHELLFANLAEVLALGGRLVSDCGGQGNIAILDTALHRAHGAPFERKAFAGPDETRRHLQAAGFRPDRVELRSDPIHFDDPAVLETYLATIALGGHLDSIDEADRPGFVREVRLAMDEPVLDYVRLEIDATRL